MKQKVKEITYYVKRCDICDKVFNEGDIKHTLRFYYTTESYHNGSEWGSHADIELCSDCKKKTEVIFELTNVPYDIYLNINKIAKNKNKYHSDGYDSKAHKFEWLDKIEIENLYEKRVQEYYKI